MKPFVFFETAICYGGSNQFTVLMIREMQKHCDIMVLDAYGTCNEYHEALRRNGIKNIVIQPNAKRTYIGRDISSGRRRIGRVLISIPEMIDFVIKLRRIIKEISPRVICTYSYKGFFLISQAIGKKIPIIYYAHGEGTFPRWYNRYNWENISLIIGVSESSLARLRNSPYQAPIMEVVPDGIDIGETIRMASARAMDLPSDGGLRLLYPAILSEIKDQATAIRGLAEYVNNGGNASLWLCGDIAAGNTDAYLRKLKTIADELNVSNRVHFLGWRDNVPSVMAECDIVLLTSVTEGFGRVLLESMCLRKPIIATRVGGIPEVVRDGIDGILFDVKDSKGFARAVEKLADPELRQRMGQAGFERVSAKYDIKKVASRFLELMNKISK